MTTARAVLHVGLPKTGTSFVQGTMRANRALLAGRGVHLPTADREPVFGAVLYLTGRSESWGRSADRGRRTWDELVREARGRTGTTVVSSETLCLADEEQVARIVGDLEVPVDVVVTARDLARQLPAEWQEGVKHGRSIRFADYLASLLDDAEPDGAARRQVRRRFWNAQDPLRVLDRWAAVVGSERVHLVTCPPSGAEPDLLWRRFAEVLGVADLPVELPPREVNTSLGALQTELLRRVNRRFPRPGNERAYGDVVKRLYAGTILRGQEGERVRLPADEWARVEQVSRRLVADVEERGYPVVGDLADLVPIAPDEPADDAAAATPARLLEASLDATADLLREVERLRADNATPRGGRTGVRRLVAGGGR